MSGATEEPVTKEPPVDLEDIQGNVLFGFNKDFQRFKLLSIVDVAPVRPWLTWVNSQVATAMEVWRYRRLRKAVKARNQGQSSHLTASWSAIAFSYRALKLLVPARELASLDNGAFEAGLAASASLLGDPSDPADPGHPKNWEFGGLSGPPIDIVVTIASDTLAGIEEVSREWDRQIAGVRSADGSPALRPVVADQDGATLPDSLRGHEHFGFKDGVSQPGLRGCVKSDPSEVLTPRTLAPSSSDAALYGRPGEALVWPGQFVLGYPRQDSFDPTAPAPPLALHSDWLVGASFMVMRKLKQDVAGFWSAMRSLAQDLIGQSDDHAVEKVAAQLVGRWPSGAPVTRSPDRDDAAFMADDRVANDFLFRNAGSAPVLADGQPPIPKLPLSIADPDGVRCPFAAHVRKVNPRDDPTDAGGPSDTLTRRVLRRGIPYGPPLRDLRHGADDGVDRGLLFVCYQSSIEQQFEFLMRQWVNGEQAPREGGGRDALLGRHRPAGAGPGAWFRYALPDGTFRQVPNQRDFIAARGGGYFLAPSRTGLKRLASHRP